MGDASQAYRKKILEYSLVFLPPSPHLLHKSMVCSAGLNPRNFLLQLRSDF